MISQRPSFSIRRRVDIYKCSSQMLFFASSWALVLYTSNSTTLYYIQFSNQFSIISCLEWQYAHHIHNFTKEANPLTRETAQPLRTVHPFHHSTLPTYLSQPTKQNLTQPRSIRPHNPQHRPKHLLRPRKGISK